MKLNRYILAFICLLVIGIMIASCISLAAPKPPSQGGQGLVEKLSLEELTARAGSIVVGEVTDIACYEEGKGNLGLVKASPEGFELVSSFKIELGKAQHWAHPVINDGLLYMRHGGVLMAYDIRAE